MGEKPSGKPPAPSPKPATPLETMAHRLQTPEGKKLYALRKQTPNRFSGSSNRCSVSVSSCCAEWRTGAARGAL